MGIYNVVHRNKGDLVLVNCGHRHDSLAEAVRCQDAYLIAGLATKVETATGDQQRNGQAVDDTVLDLVRERFYRIFLDNDK